MAYDKLLISDKLTKWNDYINSFSLPAWDKLPTIELYMDQVIVLLNDYLSYLSYEGSEENLITASMINNYVKLKLMPAPVKKRYGRMHIALLIMICHYKQVHSMASIRQMLPEHDPDTIRAAYDKFVQLQSSVAVNFAKQVKELSKGMFDECDEGYEAEELVSACSLYSTLARLLSAKIIALKTPEQEKK
ncbi:MAG: DUF1836 domain-containing protein [Clostridia bacterium]|nr:DUF1836 domain-containing protein [Clostridia bacterium]